MNLNAYDNVIDKVDKTKTWIDVKKHLLLKWYVLSKRFNTENNCYDYFVILLDNPPQDRVAFNARLDDYGRVKIQLHEMYNETDLQHLTKDANINIKHVEHEEDGDVYQLEIQLSLSIQQALITSNSSEGFIVYSKSPVRSMNKEHRNTDIVYFMYDNKPAKGVVIGECKQKLIQLDINNDEELIQCFKQ